jgi:hypothetical protein
MATTADDVWRLLGELVEAQKETERKFQETERLMQEQRQESDRLMQEQRQESDRLMQEQRQESDRRFQETERLLKEQSQETERLLKEQSQRVDKQLGKLGNRLGEFVEWQIRPAAVRLFKERGLDVHELYSGVSAQRPEGGIEIDLLVINDTEAVLIEVKSKLTQSDVDEHIERLEKFKKLMPRYSNLKALGAVAGMVVPDDIARYAYRQGLFVLAQSGENVIILNDSQFQPKAW